LVRNSARHFVDQSLNITTHGLRHMFATFYFSRWERGIQFRNEFPKIEQFLEFLACKLNTSPTMLRDVYIETGQIPIQLRERTMVLFASKLE